MKRKDRGEGEIPDEREIQLASSSKSSFDENKNHNANLLVLSIPPEIWIKIFKRLTPKDIGINLVCSYLNKCIQGIIDYHVSNIEHLYLVSYTDNLILYLKDRVLHKAYYEFIAGMKGKSQLTQQDKNRFEYFVNKGLIFSEVLVKKTKINTRLFDDTIEKFIKSFKRQNTKDTSLEIVKMNGRNGRGETVLSNCVIRQYDTQMRVALSYKSFGDSSLSGLFFNPYFRNKDGRDVLELLAYSPHLIDKLSDVLSKFKEIEDKINDLKTNKLECKDINDPITAIACRIYLKRTVGINELNEVYVNSLSGSFALNIRNINGFTRLCMDAKQGKLQKVKKLLSEGADANVPDQYGNLPLHWAARNGYLAVVEALMKQAGADINIENQFGKSALYYAREYKHWDIINLLEKKPQKQNLSGFDMVL